MIGQAHHTLDSLFIEELQTDEDDTIRVMRVGDVYQSATFIDSRYWQPVFAYQRNFDLVFDRPDTRTVLMLGGGGFSYPKYLLATHPAARIDVVEVDPAIVAAAQTSFFLDKAIEAFNGEERLRIFTQDALDFLQNETNRYDAVINDCFSGSQPARALATVNAAEQVKRHLNPGGWYVSNIVSLDEGTNVEFLRAVVATLRHVFEHVAMICVEDEEFAGEDNYLVVASDAALPLSEAIAYDEQFPTQPIEN